MAPYKALILDLGNVLLIWTPPAQTPIPRGLIKHIMASDIWGDYERGRFLEQECYAKIEKQFGVDATLFSTFMKNARESLKINKETMAFIGYLKESQRDLKIYGMTNTPEPEQGHVYATAQLWPIFDHIFISSDVDMRKPDVCFYDHVLEEIGLPGDSVIFVDDSQDNVVAALSLGMRGITYTSHEDLRCRMANILDDPVTRGYRFLENNVKELNSITNQGHIIRDNFAQLLILELTQRSDLVDLEYGIGPWNFFIGGRQLTDEIFPNDLDTTSLALSILPLEQEVVKRVMDDMLKYVSEDGIVMTYFDRTRPRVDPVVCVNVLNLFLKHGRQDELKSTWNWVLHVLQNRAYLHGTRYYSSAESFLFFLARLTENLHDPILRSQLLPTLEKRVRERIGEAGDAVVLAMRVLACQMLRVPNPRDMDKLQSLQCGDGGWPVGAIYKFGSSGLEIGNRGLVTSIALKAIEIPDPAQDSPIKPSSFSLVHPLLAVRDLLNSLLRKRLSSLVFLSAAGPGVEKY